MRESIDSGAGSVTSLAVFGLAAIFGVGGLVVATVIFRATSVVRTAELAAITVATRDAAGFPQPCAPAIPDVIECSSVDRVATVSVSRLGFRATAIAGPER